MHWSETTALSVLLNDYCYAWKPLQTQRRALQWLQWRRDNDLKPSLPCSEAFAPDPAAGPAWPASRQRASAPRAGGGLAWPMQPRRGPPETAALRTQQTLPQLKLHARQRRHARMARTLTTALRCSSVRAPLATRPSCRRTLLGSMTQRPGARPLGARAAPAAQQRAARAAARRPTMGLTRLAQHLARRTPPALRSALPGLAALLALARVQVGPQSCCHVVLQALLRASRAANLG